MSRSILAATGSNQFVRRCRMQNYETSGAKTRGRPYRNLRDEPKYEELKKIISDLPPDKMEKLKSYIQRLVRNA
jgi:hypothetical protein